MTDKLTGLTIQEAIRSGKQFRRKGEDDSCWITVENWDEENDYFDLDDILATDWEIRP
jgi:hypothetical protein